MELPAAVEELKQPGPVSHPLDSVGPEFPNEKCRWSPGRAGIKQRQLDLVTASVRSESEAGRALARAHLGGEYIPRNEA